MLVWVFDIAISMLALMLVFELMVLEFSIDISMLVYALGYYFLPVIF